MPDPARFTLPAGYENVYAMTYQIGTQFDNLNHVGVGPVFYGGHRGPDIAETWGTNKLGAENMGPVVTKGIMLDILALKSTREPPPTSPPHPTASRSSSTTTGSRSRTSRQPCAGSASVPWTPGTPSSSGPAGAS